MIALKDATTSLEGFTDSSSIESQLSASPEESPKNITGFSGTYKYSSVSFQNITYILGAPKHLLLSDYKKYESEIEPWLAKGFRVLLFGTLPDSPKKEALSCPVSPLGLILLRNPVRAEAPSTFSYFAEQGVEIKVLSGDHPLTVSIAAQEAGIPHAEQCVDASALQTAEEIEEAILSHTVFGRVTPEQKRLFIEALKENGRTVAMTGDGVNDVLALKDADCSIAMASGSDAAKNTSQLVLLDSNFSHMPSIVLEGRRVVNNLERSAALFLVKNIFSMLMALFSLILFIDYPFVPSQISLLGLCTIGTPAALLALESSKNKIRGHFLTNVFLKALPAGLTDFAAVAALSLLGKTLGLTEDALSTVALSILLTVGFTTLFRVCFPFDCYRALICLMMLSLLFLCVRLVPELFAVTLLHGREAVLQAVFSLLSIPLLFMNSFWVRKISTGGRKTKKAYRKTQKTQGNAD